MIQTFTFIRQLSRRTSLVLLSLVTILSSLAVTMASPQIVSAETNAYIWDDATDADPADLDWGYVSCPVTAPACRTKVVNNKGIRDAYQYDFRNCTSYVAFKIAEQFGGRNISGWGNANDFDVNAAAKGYAMNGTPAVGDIAQWDSGPVGHVAYVYAVTGGVAKISEYNQALTGRYQNTRTVAANAPGVKFIHMGTPMAGETSSTGGSTQAEIDGAGAIWAKKSGTTGFVQESGPSSAKVIVAGGNNQVILDMCNAIWAKNTVGYGGWTQEAGCNSATSIAVDASGNQMLLDGCGAVWSKNGISYGGWTQEAGCGTAIGISVGNGTRAMINSCKAIWTKTGAFSTSGWGQESNCNSAQKLSVGSTGKRAIVDLCGAVYAWNGTVWLQMAGCNSAKDIAVGANTYAIQDLCNAVWAKTGTANGGWTQEAGCNSAKSLKVGSEDTQLIQSLDDSIWSKTTISNGGWAQQAGAGSTTAITQG